MGLPIVTEEVFETFADLSLRDYTHDTSFIKDNISKLKVSNPELYNFVVLWCAELEVDEFVHTAMGMLVLYRLLENQAEVDELEEK